MVKELKIYNIVIAIIVGAIFSGSISYADDPFSTNEYETPPYSSGQNPLMIEDTFNQPQDPLVFPAVEFEDFFEQGLVNFYEDIYDAQSGFLLDAPGSDIAATGSLGFSIAAVTALMQQGAFDNTDEWMNRLAKIAENILFIQESQPQGDWLEILRKGNSVIALKALTDEEGSTYKNINNKIDELNKDSSLSFDERIEQLTACINEIDFEEIAKVSYGLDSESNEISVSDITEDDAKLLFNEGENGSIKWGVSENDIEAVMQYGYDGWLSHYIARDLTRDGVNTELSSVDTALLLSGLIYFSAAYGDHEYTGGDGNTHIASEQVDKILMNINMDSAQFYDKKTNRFPHGWKPYAGGLGGDYWGDEALVLHIVKALQNPGEGIDLPIEAFSQHLGSYNIQTPEEFGYILTFQSAVWTYTYARAFFDLYDYDINGVGWHENSTYGIVDNHRYAIEEGNVLGGGKGYYPYDAWISTCEVYGTPENPESGFQMHHAAEPRWSGLESQTMNDGSFSPYSALSALSFLPFQAWQSLIYHYSLTPELTNEMRNRYGFSDSTYRDPFTREGDYRYTSITYSINTGESYLMYLNTLDGSVWQTMMQNPRVAALFGDEDGGVTQADIQTPEELKDELSGNLDSVDASTQFGAIESAVTVFSSNPSESALVAAADALRAIITFDAETPLTLKDFDSITDRISTLEDNDLKTYLLAEVSVAKIHYLAGVVNSYPDQRATIAFREYRDEYEESYSRAWNLLDGIESPALKPQVLALQFCILKNNFMIDDQVAVFEELSEIWNNLDSEDYKTAIVDTIESYDYEATLIAEDFSYEQIATENGEEDWRLRVDSTLYDWYGRWAEPLDVRKALEGDFLSSRVYRYFEWEAE